MPELPEVQTVVTTLRPRVIGCRIGQVRLLRADILCPAGFDLAAALRGRVVTDLTRRGKRIVFSLDDANRFYIHLGMTGRLTTSSPEADPVKHTHLIIDLQAPARSSPPLSIRFVDPRRFGGVFWLGRNSPAGDMGPEPLTMRPVQLAARLAKTGRAIKNVLLDQTVLAGVGNIYADESLFLARIHPLSPANLLSTTQVRRLNRAIKLTLRRAIRHRGSTLRDFVDADGLMGGYQKQHRVYDQAGKPCHTCRAAIERIVLGGRSTHFCPTCQAPE